VRPVPAHTLRSRPVTVSAEHPLSALQRAAGNRAVADVLTAAPITVFRCGADQHPNRPCADRQCDEAGSVLAVQRSESSTTTNEHNPSELGAEVGVISEAACTVLPDLVVVGLVRGTFRVGYALAYRHLQHYLDGSGSPFIEDVTALFSRNPRAADRVAKMIHDRGGAESGRLIGRTTSSAVIRQSDYDDEDWRLSIGGVDEIDYEVLERYDSGTALVELSIHDPYEWHPAEDRGSQCLHEVMERQKENGAKNFVSEGAGRVRMPI
jgi:hypothetical protein